MARQGNEEVTYKTLIFVFTLVRDVVRTRVHVGAGRWVRAPLETLILPQTASRGLRFHVSRLPIFGT